MLGVDDMRPRDIIFAYERPLGWIRDMYPDAARQFSDGESLSEDYPIELIEYVDAEEQVPYRNTCPCHRKRMCRYSETESEKSAVT